MVGYNIIIAIIVGCSSLVRLFCGFERDLYDLGRPITLTELFDFFHRTELTEYLVQLFEPDAARHVADDNLVGAETETEHVWFVVGQQRAAVSCEKSNMDHHRMRLLGYSSGACILLCRRVSGRERETTDIKAVYTEILRHYCETMSSTAAAAVTSETSVSAGRSRLRRRRTSGGVRLYYFYSTVNIFFFVFVFF